MLPCDNDYIDDNDLLQMIVSFFKYRTSRDTSSKIEHARKYVNLYLSYDNYFADIHGEIEQIYPKGYIRWEKIIDALSKVVSHEEEDPQKYRETLEYVAYLISSDRNHKWLLQDNLCVIDKLENNVNYLKQTCYILLCDGLSLPEKFVMAFDFKKCLHYVVNNELYKGN